MKYFLILTNDSKLLIQQVYLLPQMTLIIFCPKQAHFSNQISEPFLLPFQYYRQYNQNSKNQSFIKRLPHMKSPHQKNFKNPFLKSLTNRHLKNIGSVSQEQRSFHRRFSHSRRIFKKRRLCRKYERFQKGLREYRENIQGSLPQKKFDHGDEIQKWSRPGEREKGGKSETPMMQMNDESEKSDKLQSTDTKIEKNEDCQNIQISQEGKEQILGFLRNNQHKYVPKRMKESSVSLEIRREKITTWLSEICDTFAFGQETLLLAINTFDRVLGEVRMRSKIDFLIVGLASIHLAAKYEEITVPPLFNFLKMVDESYEISEKKVMFFEDKIWCLLNFDLSYTSPLTFVEELKLGGKIDSQFQESTCKTKIKEFLLKSSDYRYQTPCNLAKIALEKSHQEISSKGHESSLRQEEDSDDFYAL